MEKKKILLFFAGGTIAMAHDVAKSGVLAPKPGTMDFATVIPELRKHYDFDTQFITDVDSTNIQSSHWSKIATIIHANYDKYDGFVITHGTDTMSFTASAVSFALQDLGKPVVFTGSQLPITDLRTDARLNIINAFKVATMDIGEVVIVFGSKIIRGNRSTKFSESEFTAFGSNKYPSLGTIRTEIKLSNYHQPRRKSKLKLSCNFEPDISVYTVTPSTPHKFFDILIENNVKGVVITAVGAGNIPTGQNPLNDSIKKATKKHIPVVMATQCSHGTVDLSIYETGQAALNAGAISAQDMTIEAATTKLMWTLMQTDDIDEAKKIFTTNLAGEITKK